MDGDKLDGLRQQLHKGPDVTVEGSNACIVIVNYRDDSVHTAVKHSSDAALDLVNHVGV